MTLADNRSAHEDLHQLLFFLSLSCSCKLKGNVIGERHLIRQSRDLCPPPLGGANSAKFRSASLLESSSYEESLRLLCLLIFANKRHCCCAYFIFELNI